MRPSRGLPGRRRDELTPYEAEIAREHFPVPGHPAPVRRAGVFRETAREIATALRRIDATNRQMSFRADAALFIGTLAVASTITLGAVHAGASWEDARQDDQIEAAYHKVTAERGALSGAYRLAFESEMQDRGYSEEEIERAQDAHYAGVMGEEVPESEELPEPRQADTLQLRAQLDEAQGRWRALFEQMAADD